MEKKLLMVDMDDVIFLNSMNEAVEQFLGRKITEEEYALCGYYLQRIIPDKKAFFDFLFAHNYYDFGHIAPDCSEVLKILKEQYRLYILTKYVFYDEPFRSGVLLSQKHEALLNNFPFLTPDNFIFTNDKSIIKPAIVIDDLVANLKTARKRILFSSYHNLHLTEQELLEQKITRVNNWQEIGHILIKK